MQGLLHRHPCRKEFKKMEMPFDAMGRREPSTESRTQSGACASLARKGNQGNGNGQVLQEVPGRALVSVGKDLGL